MFCTHRGEYDNFMAKSGILDLSAASKTLKCKDYGTADTKIGPLSRTSMKFNFVVLGAENGSKMANFGYFLVKISPQNHKTEFYRRATKGSDFSVSSSIILTF